MQVIDDSYQRQTDGEVFNGLFKTYHSDLMFAYDFGSDGSCHSMETRYLERILSEI